MFLIVLRSIIFFCRILKTGKSYQRTLDGDGGKEYLSPAGEGEFRHEVAGEAHGGWGGSNTMPLSTLNNGRWEQDSWEL